MANMSYCRFQNTLEDLQDCADNLMDKLSGQEYRARLGLIYLCVNILGELGVDVNVDCEALENLAKCLPVNSSQDDE